MKNLDMESLYMNVLYRIKLDTGRKRTATDAIKMIMPWLLSAENNLIQTLRDGGRSLDFWLLLVHGIVESVANAFLVAANLRTTIIIQGILNKSNKTDVLRKNFDPSWNQWRHKMCFYLLF